MAVRRLRGHNPPVLDVALRSLAYRSLRDVTFTFARSAHTAIVGDGASTVLQLIAGTTRPEKGEIVIGQRLVNDVKAKHRPLLFVNSELDVPGRWSVQHALIAAVRGRSLDQIDRRREYELAAEKWELGALLERRVDSLSSTEQTRVLLARIELLRPAIVVADRLLERASGDLADTFYRTLRVHGTTVISAPASRDELALTDAVVVLDEGRIIQSGSAAEVFARPLSEAAAIATGLADFVPVTIHGNLVESVIGAWELADPPFQGSGIAITRPSFFSRAQGGEDSDFVFGVEEAGFANGRWIARGVLSGGVTLRVELPHDAPIHKGRLIAMKYDPARFTLLPRELEPLQTSVPTDAVPPMSETR